MRILFATSIDGWGGGEKWMTSAATGLAGRGHETALVARPGSPILARAAEAGRPTFAAPFLSDLDPVSFVRVWRWCRAHRPDVVVLNMDRALRVAGAAARVAGVRAVIPRRGSEFPLKDGRLYRFTYQKIATSMIVNSRATADTLVERIDWRPAGTVHVLLNGLDPAPHDTRRPRDDVRRELGLSPDAPVLITVGELTTRKNVRLLLDAIPRLLRHHPDLSVLVAGEGDERNSLQARARELGVSESFHLLGFRRDVPDLLGAADLLVHPARVEGFGYAVAEAMAAGIPVVATNASSLPEVVDDGVTGALFPPEDGDAMVRAIEGYLADPALRVRHGEAGSARARAEFSAERRLSELEGILRAEVDRAAG